MAPTPLISNYSRRAMATEFVVMIPGDIDGNAEHAFAALEIAEKVENYLSIYRPNSDISRLNRAAGCGSVPVGAMTFQVLALAQQLSELTGGAFDVTAGPLVEVWGFSKRQGSKPTEPQLQAARELVGFQHLRLDHTTHTAELLKPGMSVNLGAIGKGFALDLIGEELKKRGVHNFLVHGGNSSILAAGDDIPDTAQGWRVAIEHPILNGVRLGGLRLRNQALGTSGSGKQFFHFQGKRFGHVIDPRTGTPAGDLLSLTVVSRSAAVADALATGLFVTGAEAALQWTAVIEPAQELMTLGTIGPDDDKQKAIDPLSERLGIVAIRSTSRQAEVQLSTAGIEPNDWLPADESEA